MTFRIFFLFVSATLASTCHAGISFVVALAGQCERLVVAGRDISDACEPKLIIGAKGKRAEGIQFATKDGRRLSFEGDFALEERADSTSPLLPTKISVLIEEKGAVNTVPTPLVGLGACNVRTLQAGKMAIVCRATVGNARFEGNFVADAP